MAETKCVFAREGGKWTVRYSGQSTVTEYDRLEDAIYRVLLSNGNPLVFSHCGGTMNFEVRPEVIRPGFVRVFLFGEDFRGDLLQTAEWMTNSLKLRLYNG